MALLFLSAVLLTAAPDNPDLKRGEELFAQYKYPEAIKALTKARAVKGLDREGLLKILELLGVSHGHLRQTAPAQAAFREMLVIDPTRQLAAEYAPRVMTPFYEVRQEVLDQGALEIRGSATVTATTVESLTVLLVRDPLGMAKAVRFHVDGKDTDVVLAGGVARLALNAPGARWWAELLGENEAVIAFVASEASPRTDAPVPAAAPAVAGPSVVATPAPPPRGGGLRTASYAVMVAGVGTAGLGLYFGAQSNDAYGQVRRALTMKNAQGLVTGISERRAQELNAQGAQQALIANVMITTGAVVAATGVAMWVFGGPTATVALAPAPGGVAIVGVIP